MIAEEIRGLVRLGHELAHQNPEYLLALYMAFMSLVQTIPTPGPGASWIHCWIYDWAHRASMNWRAAGQRRTEARPQ
jgi:hypothetical protein